MVMLHGKRKMREMQRCMIPLQGQDVLLVVQRWKRKMNEYKQIKGKKKTPVA
jgi:hypothetical protein